MLAAVLAFLELAHLNWTWAAKRLFWAMVLVALAPTSAGTCVDFSVLAEPAVWSLALRCAWCLPAKALLNLLAHLGLSLWAFFSMAWRFWKATTVASLTGGRS